MSVYGGGGGGDYGGSMPAGVVYAPAPMPPKVRFEIIGEAWDLFQKQMGTWVLSVLILFVITFTVSFALRFSGTLAGLGAIGRDGDADVTLASVSFRLFSSLITNLITFFLLGGLYKMALKQIRGLAIGVSDLFSAGSVFIPLFLTNLLYGVCVLGGTILCIIPGLIFASLLILSPLLIVDKRETSPVQALKASWNVLKTDMLNAVLFLFVLGIVSVAGVLGCGVGLLFTYPLLPLGYALLYRDFFGLGTAEAVEPRFSEPQNPWVSGQAPPPLLPEPPAKN